MSEENEHANPQAVRDLAASIYARLVTEAVGFTDSGVKITASPENIARTSYKLAEAFQKIENERTAASQPKSTALDVGQINFGS